MDVTNRYFLFVMIAAAGIAASTALSNADSRSAVRQIAAPTASEQAFVYFPAQFTLNAPSQPAEHIQAF